MAIIKCPECGKEISDTVDTCIHCGYKIKNNKEDDDNKNKKFNPLIFVIVLVLIIIGISLFFIINSKNNGTETNKWKDAKYSNLYYQSGYVEAKNPATLNINYYTPDYKYLILPIYLGEYAFKTTTVSNANPRDAITWKPLYGYDASLARVDLKKYSKEEIEEYWYGKSNSANSQKEDNKQTTFFENMRQMPSRDIVMMALIIIALVGGTYLIYKKVKRKSVIIIIVAIVCIIVLFFILLPHLEFTEVNNVIVSIDFI